jgi:hypothetical protein
MKRVASALNETDYKGFQKTLNQLNTTQYKLINSLILEFMKTGNVDMVKAELLIKKVADDIVKDIRETKKNLI